MNLDEVIKLIEERKRMWREYSERIYDHLYEGKEHPTTLLKKLMGEDYEGRYLISDCYYDHECARIIACELETILNALEKARAEGRE